MSKRLFSCLFISVRRPCRLPRCSKTGVATFRYYGATSDIKTLKSESDYTKKRVDSLGGYGMIHRHYRLPRYHVGEATVSSSFFRRTYGERGILKSYTAENITVYGRVVTKHQVGKSLLFLQLGTGEVQSSTIINTQIKLSLNRIRENTSELSNNAVHQFSKQLQRGDWIAARGVPYQDKEGHWAIEGIEIPAIMAPALQPIPLELEDEEFRMSHRHADQIVHPESRDVIFLRHKLLQQLHRFLDERGFVQVTTPTIQAAAGGAIARPFETVATEFSGRNLNLRVAPELFLKRLIIGGMPKVYEVGTAFRNEGVDLTHNPEFTICEFYGVMLRLQNLIRTTELLFQKFATCIRDAKQNGLASLPDVDLDFYASPFKTIHFVPALGEAIRQRLPDWRFPLLESPGAFDYLIQTFEDLNLPTPSHPTLPRLLDALSGEFLEPQCQHPTFILHQPECLAPLARSQKKIFPTESEHDEIRVSMRAELFIHGREYVNCYEEENSPITQRRKFKQQLDFRQAGDVTETYSSIDESYLSAMEWGMPPTGGWGCGFDRIVMLFSGKKRIADVLPFGNLRNVVALGSGPPTRLAETVSSTTSESKQANDERDNSQDGRDALLSSVKRNPTGALDWEERDLQGDSDSFEEIIDSAWAREGYEPTEEEKIDSQRLKSAFQMSDELEASVEDDLLRGAETPGEGSIVMKETTRRRNKDTNLQSTSSFAEIRKGSKGH